jgi:hypothetical protein
LDDGNGISFWDQVVALIGAATFWMTGESGRVLIASGAGGFVRWIADEKRRIGTGILAILGGAIVGFYCWPGLLHLPAIWGGDVIDKTPESIAMAGFLAGTMGVSGVKIFVAVMEARAARLRGDNDADK